MFGFFVYAGGTQTNPKRTFSCEHGAAKPHRLAWAPAVDFYMRPPILRTRSCPPPRAARDRR